MALTINRGEIIVNITPEELLKYFGVNMETILEATSSAIQKWTGGKNLNVSHIQGYEEALLDLIFEKLEADALWRIECNAARDEKKSTEFVKVDDDEDLLFKEGEEELPNDEGHYFVFVDDVLVCEFIGYDEAEAFMNYKMEKCPFSDISITNSIGETVLGTIPF